jgi:hypothetical protein
VSSISIIPAQRPALRLTRRGRAVFGGLAAAPIVIGIVLASVSTPAMAGSEVVSASYRTVTVSAGESLWSIAERIAPDQDPRDVIVDISRLNSLADQSVVPGQSLAIPARYVD